MSDSDIVLLLNYIAGTTQRYKHVPGRGEPEPVDEYHILVTKEQRDVLVNALRSYFP